MSENLIDESLILEIKTRNPLTNDQILRTVQAPSKKLVSFLVCSRTHAVSVLCYQSAWYGQCL